MLKLAGVKKDDVVYDLGCGTAHCNRRGEKRWGAASGLTSTPCASASRRTRGRGRKAGALRRERLFDAISARHVVTLFLLPSVNLKLRPKLLQDLKPGTRIVSNTFDMGDWKPEKEVTLTDSSGYAYLSHRLLLWIVPARTAK